MLSLLIDFLTRYGDNVGEHTGDMIFKLAGWLNKCIDSQPIAHAVVNVNDANEVVVKTVLHCAAQQLEPVIVGVFKAGLFHITDQASSGWVYRTLMACCQEFGRDGQTSALESLLLSECWRQLCSTVWGDASKLEAMSEVLDLVNRLLPQSENVGELIQAKQFDLLVQRITQVVGLPLSDKTDKERRLDIVRQVREQLAGE